jgi:fumarate hydratase subunit beta
MDRWTPRLLELGLKGIMGKGGRGPAIREELKEHTAVYMAALGGGGALAALTVRSQEIIAFEDLATEAIRRMELDDFPVWVVNDCEGRDFYSETVKPWRRNELLPESLHMSTDEWADKNGGG